MNTSLALKEKAVLVTGRGRGIASIAAWLNRYMSYMSYLRDPRRRPL
jgi:hypothetical protein